MPVSKQTVYLNADKTEVVEEGSPDAAFLLAREGGSISREDAEQYGVEFDEEQVYDAKRDHFEKHGGMDPTVSPLELRRRQSMLRGEDDPDGPAAPGERGNLEEAAAEPEGDGPEQGDVEAKAVDAPPANKARRAADNK